MPGHLQLIVSDTSGNEHVEGCLFGQQIGWKVVLHLGLSNQPAAAGDRRLCKNIGIHTWKAYMTGLDEFCMQLVDELGPTAPGDDLLGAFKCFSMRRLSHVS